MDEHGDYDVLPLNNFYFWGGGRGKLASTDTYTKLEFFCITKLELRSLERKKVFQQEIMSKTKELY